MILACQGISKAFGENVIVADGSFHIEEHEKVALVGPNGAGKTTILKMIVGELEPDDGTVVFAKGSAPGYLAQYQDMPGDHTIYGEVRAAKADVIEAEKRIRQMELEMRCLSGERLDALMDSYNRLTAWFERENGYACESEITGVLKGLGFSEDEFGKKISSLSGGQKTRVSLGRLLLEKPDILLLDEPTNHLDLNSIAWLENYLLNYPGAVLIVSHDRYFLNRVVSKVIDIEDGKLTSYLGNYSQYAEKKRMLREAKLKEYLNQQREIRRQEAVIEKLRSFNREKSIKRAESREKLLERIRPVERPSENGTEIHINLEPAVTSGNDVLSVEHLGKSFPPHTLFTDVSFEIKRGEHVAVIGDNGTGKTTLLKILNELLPADTGSFRLGTNVQIGYYDQEQHVLNMDKTIFDEISDDYPSLTNTEIRSMLAAFLFTGDDVFKRIGDLSGGERGRVSLAKLMLSEANFLILDEPTNHLDIPSKEILERAMNDYAGTILYVSHDRYFINQTATRILELKNRTFVNYIGNYDYYLEKCEELTRVYAPASDGASTRNVGAPAASPDDPRTQSSTGASAASPDNLRAQPFTDASAVSPARTVSDAKQSWQAQKEAQALKRKRQNELKRTEERISALEEEDAQIDRQLALEEVYTNSVKCQELAKRKAAIADELEKLYEKWETLAE